MKYREISDYANTDVPEQYGGVAGGRASVRIGWDVIYAPGTPDHNRMRKGSLRVVPAREGAPDMVTFLWDAHAWYPLDRADVVMPQPLWPVDSDGRGLSVLEALGRDHLRGLTQRRIAADVERDRGNTATTVAA